MKQSFKNPPVPKREFGTRGQRERIARCGKDFLTSRPPALHW
jgi:hypothetical protein